MQKIKVVVFALLLGPLPPALGFESSCKNLPTQAELSQCAYEEMEKSNSALNSVYTKLMAELNGEEKLQLRSAERAWIDYRDKMCGFVGLSVKGGSMEGMVISLCHTELIEEQLGQLSEQLQIRQ